MRINLILLFIVFFVLVNYSCSKNSGSTNNNNNQSDTTRTDTIYGTITKTPQWGLYGTYSCCIRVVWGDGIVTNFSSPTTQLFSHNYSDINSVLNLQVSAKGLTEINFNGEIGRAHV